jgi:tRNA G37 N-methylase TrmD
MRIDLLTLVPDSCGVLKESIVGRARERGSGNLCRNIRDYTPTNTAVWTMLPTAAERV